MLVISEHFAAGAMNGPHVDLGVFDHSEMIPKLVNCQLSTVQFGEAVQTPICRSVSAAKTATRSFLERGGGVGEVICSGGKEFPRRSDR